MFSHLFSSLYISLSAFSVLRSQPNGHRRRCLTWQSTPLLAGFPLLGLPDFHFEFEEVNYWCL
jgi:hypothetical protein